MMKCLERRWGREMRNFRLEKIYWMNLNPWRREETCVLFFLWGSLDCREWPCRLNIKFATHSGCFSLPFKSRQNVNNKSRRGCLIWLSSFIEEIIVCALHNYHSFESARDWFFFHLGASVVLFTWWTAGFYYHIAKIPWKRIKICECIHIDSWTHSKHHIQYSNTLFLVSLNNARPEKL